MEAVRRYTRLAILRPSAPLSATDERRREICPISYTKGPAGRIYGVVEDVLWLVRVPKEKVLLTRLRERMYVAGEA
jgi:hypothetical protein